MSTTTADAPTAAEPMAITGLDRVVLHTPDLDRFRRFYESIVGIRLLVTMRMDDPPHQRHSLYCLGGGGVLHVFETPGSEPAERDSTPRIERFGFRVADRDALDRVAGRLAAAGAAEGPVTDRGPVFAISFHDPDGNSLDVSSANPGFDGATMPGTTIEAVGEVGAFASSRA